MRKITRVLAGMMAVAALTLTSCSDDEETLAPSITSTADGTTMSATPGQTISFTVDVREGDKNLDRVTVREDGNIIDGREVTVEGEDISGTGMYELNSNMELDIVIEVPSVEGTYTYSVAALDNDGNSDGIEFDVEVGPIETPLVESTGHTFYNADGTQPGGFDLSAGTAVSSSSADGDLQDLGLDIVSSDWRGEFQAENGASMVSVAATYYDMATEENVMTYFESGDTEAGAVTAVEGDVYIVSADSKYYVIKITDVNVDSSGNDDSITFSMKQAI